MTQSFTWQMVPGETESIQIEVENDSEVVVAYSITAENPSDNLPLYFSFVEGQLGQEESAMLTQEMIPGEKQTFTLHVAWPKGDHDLAYVGRVDNIQITLNATQVD